MDDVLGAWMNLDHKLIKKKQSLDAEGVRDQTIPKHCSRWRKRWRRDGKATERQTFMNLKTKCITLCSK